MDFAALRNNIEHISAGIRHANPTDSTLGHGPIPGKQNVLLADAVLTFGQTLVGMYEELAGIRKALEHDRRVVPTQEIH